VPFRTERRYMATVHDTPDGQDGPLVVVKGAPEVVLSMCASELGEAGETIELEEDDARRRGEELAGEGLRVIAVATGRGEELARSVLQDRPGGLTLAGLHGLVDPPRDSAIEAIERSHQAGIRVLMVTGDHATTAVAIGEQVGIRRPTGDGGDGRAGRSAVTGQELGELSDEDLRPLLDETNVYARVAPGQKLRIVEGLQAEDHIVAVTGDGVNDAPALESAHIGASMGSGTDVAKEASDMVITDDDFASVYAAVEEGRTAFRNVRVATFFLLSTGGAVVLVILAALGLDWPLPLLPAQILWCNVVTNGIADVALAFEPGEKALFRRPPRPKSEGVLDRTLLERLVLVALWLAVGTAAVFYWSWGIRGDDLEIARTMALTTMVLFQKVHVFNCRSEDVSIFGKSLLSNKLLFAGVLTSLAVHIGALYWPVTQDLLGVAPLDATSWLVAIAVASTAILVNELHKRLRPRPVVVA
jgi:Ca2+-transporting ATPase